MGGQISWLLPAALILLVAGRACLDPAGRGRDTARSPAFLVWGGSLLMTIVIFSFMPGSSTSTTPSRWPRISPRWSAWARALLWRSAAGRRASLVLAPAVAATAAWAYVLLNRSPDWLPWLRWTVLVGGLVAALGLLFVARSGAGSRSLAAGLGVAPRWPVRWRTR